MYTFVGAEPPPPPPFPRETYGPPKRKDRRPLLVLVVGHVLVAALADRLQHDRVNRLSAHEVVPDVSFEDIARGLLSVTPAVEIDVGVVAPRLNREFRAPAPGIGLGIIHCRDRAPPIPAEGETVALRSARRISIEVILRSDQVCVEGALPAAAEHRAEEQSVQVRVVRGATGETVDVRDVVHLVGLEEEPVEVPVFLVPLALDAVEDGPVVKLLVADDESVGDRTLLPADPQVEFRTTDAAQVEVALVEFGVARAVAVVAVVVQIQVLVGRSAPGRIRYGKKLKESWLWEFVSKS